MKQVERNNSGGANSVFGQLAAEKKKSVVALCLIALMAFMWIRVLGGETPESAKAALAGQQAIKAQANTQVKISFIELPKVKGRNDVLTRDFFVVDGGRLGGEEEVGVMSKGGGEVERVVQKLKLEAIGLGGSPQAFINNRLVSIGDELVVRDGTTRYEFEVVGIEERTVLVRCGEAEIELKLEQGLKVAD
jgi:hypothetical protein